MLMLFVTCRFFWLWWWRRYVNSETSVLTRAARRHITEHAISQSLACLRIVKRTSAIWERLRSCLYATLRMSRLRDSELGAADSVRTGKGYQLIRCTLCTATPTWLEVGLNPGLRGGKSAQTLCDWGMSRRMTRVVTIGFSVTRLCSTGPVQFSSVRHGSALPNWKCGAGIPWRQKGRKSKQVRPRMFPSLQRPD